MSESNLAKVSSVWPMLDEGRAEEAHRMLRELLAQEHDSDTRSAALLAMGYAACAVERFDEAREACRELSAIACTDTERHIALHQLGMVERLAGNLPLALAIFEQGQALIPSTDAPGSSANGYERAFVCMKLGRLSEAAVFITDALAQGKASGDMICIACAYRCMGEIAWAQGRADDAAAAWDASEQAFLDGGDPVGAQEVRVLRADAGI